MRLGAPLVVALALAAVEPGGATARPLAPLSWSVAGFLDHQPPYGGGAPPAEGTPLASISCPSASLCVAGDAFAKIAISTDPAAGPASWHVSHTAAGIVPLSPGIGAVSCPAVSLCVALDPTGNVLTSTNPAGGGSAWKATRVENPSGGPVFVGRTLSALSCPSVSLCVAGDRDGSILTSTSPSGGRWRTLRLGFNAGFLGITAVSCPSTRFCAAVDGSGHVVTSANPAGGASAWKVQDFDARNPLSGISCPSAALCVAVDNNAALTSTNPTGGPSTWQRATIDPTSAGIGRLNAVACPSTSLCVAVDSQGNVITSTNPASGTSAWHVDPVDPASSFAGGIPPLSGLTAISCPSASFCASVDSAGNVVRTTNPAGGRSAWTLEQIDGTNEPTGLACPSGGCVAVDAAGNVLASTRPANTGSWRVTAVDDTGGRLGGTGAVACPSAAFCAAVDGDASVLAGTNPLSGSSWRATSADTGHALASISCPSASLCVAVDDAGNAVVSTDPADPSPTWVVNHVDPDVTSVGTQASLTDISCPSVSLCVAVDDAGNVVGSTNPAGGPGAWTATAVDEGTPLAGIACPSTSLCVAAGGSTVAVATAPAAAKPSWAVTTIPGRFAMQRISCTGPSMCVGTDQNGDVTSSDDPAGGGVTWNLTHVQEYGIPAVACAVSNACFALDGVGNLLVGAQPSLRELLSKLLHTAGKPAGRVRRIRSLLSVGGYWRTLKPPLPGRLTVSWHLRGTRTTLAAARVSARSVQAQTFEVKLTPAGRRLLRHAKSARVRAIAVYTPVGGPPITISAAFTLTR